MSFIVNLLLLLIKGYQECGKQCDKFKCAIVADVGYVRRFLEEKPSPFSQCSLQLVA
jgi:hypothetical protein